MMELYSLRIFLFLLQLFCHCFSDDNYKNPHFSDGRHGIVHLFEWRWNDIAEECQRFLGPYGFGGVQISPPNENAIIMHGEVIRPWYERYQPVSYKLETRSGNETEFEEMVRTCNNAGVRIYVDVVINHMTGNLGSGHGTGGSYFDSHAHNYPAVPYGPADFNACDERCGTDSCNIEDYDNVNQVQNCRLLGLLDLNQTKEHVREKITNFLNHLTSIGVAGFRVDATKHMNPTDLSAIYSKLEDLNTEFFAPGLRPFIYQEVIHLGGDAVSINQYSHLGRITEFKVGVKLGEVFRKRDGMKWLRNFGEDWGLMRDGDALVFIDNHDNQRGHGGGGTDTILTFRDSRLYKMATAFLLAWNYGVARVMSSFNWEKNVVWGNDINNWIGPPKDDDNNVLPVVVNSDLTCGNGWICEHRWRQIYNMVRFRTAVAGTSVNDWWENGIHQIAFSRGDRGFIAINNEDFPLNAVIQTGLEPGTYCDVISGNVENGKCTGRSIIVDDDRKVNAFVDNDWEDPMIATHSDAKI